MCLTPVADWDRDCAWAIDFNRCGRWDHQVRVISSLAGRVGFDLADRPVLIPSLVSPLQFDAGGFWYIVKHDGVKAVMVSVEVLDRVVGDDNVRQRVVVVLVHLNQKISDGEIVARIQVSIIISSDAHSNLVHPAIIVVAGDVVNADPRQVVNGSLFERQQRALRSCRRSRVSGEGSRIDVTIKCEFELATCCVSSRARCHDPINDVYLLRRRGLYDPQCYQNIKITRWPNC
ncbi:hypothetical protein OAF65_07645 [Verrucomicrobiales bacterium]|nr:hypothetical protein [Verrucomicrobiales bacterium]